MCLRAGWRHQGTAMIAITTTAKTTASRTASRVIMAQYTPQERSGFSLAQQRARE